MFNRIRISTSLFLLLMTFCVLQLASSGLSYSAFRSDNHNLDIITLGSQQRDSLSLSWVSLLQARNTLNRAGTRAALKLPQEQVNELMSSARSSLQKADLYFNQFMAVERSSEQQSQQTATTKASYERLRGALRELIGFLERGAAGIYGSADAENPGPVRSRLCAVPAVGQRRHQRSQRRQPVLLHAGGPDAGGGGLDADRGDRQRHVVVAYHAGAAAEPNPQPL